MAIGNSGDGSQSVGANDATKRGKGCVYITILLVLRLAEDT
jgi:hypothetical protein